MEFVLFCFKWKTAYRIPAGRGELHVTRNVVPEHTV
jgi:hypothetical protein